MYRISSTLFGNIRGMRLHTSNRPTPLPRKRARLTAETDLARAWDHCQERLL